jgi:hypothetical protein
VDSFRSFYLDTTLPGALAPGDYEVLATATGVDGQAISKTLSFSVAENGSLLFDQQANFRTGYQEPEFRVMEPSVSWLVDDFLPALVLILLAQGGIFLTLTERNKRRQHAQS